MFRRLITTGRLRRIFSETELIAIASTNFVATSARPSGASTILLAAVINPAGTRLSTNAAPSPKIPMFAFFFDGFDLDRFNFFVVERSDIDRFSDVYYAQLSFQAARDSFKSGMSEPSEFRLRHEKHQIENVWPSKVPSKLFRHSTFVLRHCFI